MNLADALSEICLPLSLRRSAAGSWCVCVCVDVVTSGLHGVGSGAQGLQFPVEDESDMVTMGEIFFAVGIGVKASVVKAMEALRKRMGESLRFSRSSTRYQKLQSQGRCTYV